MKKLLIPLPIVVALFLGACSDSSEKKDEGTKTEVKKDNETKEETTSDVIYHKIGEKVTFEDVDYTLKSAKLSDSDPYGKPKKGKILTLNFNVKNNSDRKVYISSTSFRLYKDGKELDAFYGGEKRLGGDYEKGANINGAIQYDVDGPGEYTIKYLPADALDTKEIHWKFDVKE